MKTLHVEYDRDGVLLNAWREIDGEWAMTFQTRQGAMRAINSRRCGHSGWPVGIVKRPFD